MKGKAKTATSENSNKLRWAQFVLEAVVKCWVLLLFTLLLIFFMALIGWLVWSGKDPTGAIIGAAITAFFTGVSALLPGVIKSGIGSKSE